jgi:glycosyltransferase involved in cell wall biosynthesis
LRGHVVVTSSNWVVCQIGARENYAVARALHRHKRLTALVTDAWSPHLNALRRMAPRFALRDHSELAGAHVVAPTFSAIGHEMRARVAGVRGTDRNIERNHWFQEKAKKALRHVRRAQSTALTVFAYSYAAAEIFAFAREAGWRTVLGQIDPGIAEDRIVREADPQGYAPKPESYWSSWRRELDLADVVVVNSQWSRAALESEGASPGKIAVVPLAYEPRSGAEAQPMPQRKVPDRFSDERKLRVLFLGQIIPRKGVRPLLDAIRQLQGEPIEFHFVGPSAPAYEHELRNSANIAWHGALPRDQTDRHYAAADVFVLPTLSDGFALTQLEAMSFGLPVIASRFCGEVVRDRENGLILEEVSSRMIAGCLRALCESPALVKSLQEGAASTRIFGIDDLYERLESLPDR